MFFYILFHLYISVSGSLPKAVDNMKIDLLCFHFVMQTLLTVLATNSDSPRLHFLKSKPFTLFDIIVSIAFLKSSICPSKQQLKNICQNKGNYFQILFLVLTYYSQIVELDVCLRKGSFI